MGIEAKPFRCYAIIATMGLFHVRGRLTGPTDQTEEIDLLVDTGATLLVVPRDLADRLDLVSRRSQRVAIGGGRREIWPVAEVRLTLDGQEVTTPCFIAPAGPALLGAVPLESLFLAVDPVARRLVPVEGFVGAALTAPGGRGPGESREPRTCPSLLRQLAS